MKKLYIPTFKNISNIDLEVKDKYPDMIKEKDPDIIIVSGGDGALLHAIQDYNYLNIPFFGIANGTKNFLMNKCENFSSIEFNSLDIIEAHSIQIQVKRPRSNGSKKIILDTIAINDVVIGSKIMDFNKFSINGFNDENLSIKGMGLIFSTAIGSTAFFYNNGGKIIEDISSNTIGFASIVAENVKSFNTHISIKNEIWVKIDSDRSTPFIFIDGEAKVMELKQNDLICITSGETIKLAFNDRLKFIQKRKGLN